MVKVIRSDMGAMAAGVDSTVLRGVTAGVKEGDVELVSMALPI